MLYTHESVSVLVGCLIAWLFADIYSYMSVDFSQPKKKNLKELPKPDKLKLSGKKDPRWVVLFNNA